MNGLEPETGQEQLEVLPSTAGGVLSTESEPSQLAQFAHWSYQVDTPFRPVHELADVASTGVRAYQHEDVAGTSDVQTENQDGRELAGLGDHNWVQQGLAEDEYPAMEVTWPFGEVASAQLTDLSPTEVGPGGYPSVAARSDMDSTDEAFGALTQAWLRLSDVQEEEGGARLGTGVSPLAVQAGKQWDAGDRPKQWQGRVYGLVVHTTGGGLPAAARKSGRYHTVQAVDHYTQSHGCHYVNGWRGVAGGDLLQIANEREQAHGVGVTNKNDPKRDQRRSIDLGRFEADLPQALVKLWRSRWPGRKHSLELLPGTRTANSCYLHLECVPCVFHFGGKLITDAEPLHPGLRFTRAQHDAVAQIVCDIARRNGWPLDERWWRTPRLLGHEDLTPLSRHDSNGGWDPGYLRARPYFDWDYVYGVIERIQQGDPQAPTMPSPSAPKLSIFGALGSMGDHLRALLRGGQERAAIALARQRGITDAAELTNLVFFARHPELDGRRIQPGERDLAREWLDIRDRVLRGTL